MAVARAALDAREFKIARDALQPLMERPTRRVALLMAEIERTEHGDEGRAREWMARALNAPRDPAWIADGIVSERWLPMSPVSGRLDAFAWTTPMAALEGPRTQDIPEPQQRDEEPAIEPEMPVRETPALLDADKPAPVEPETKEEPAGRAGCAAAVLPRRRLCPAAARRCRRYRHSGGAGARRSGPGARARSGAGSGMFRSPAGALCSVDRLNGDILEARSPAASGGCQLVFPWQCLYFFPEPHGHGSFLRTDVSALLAPAGSVLTV